MNLPRIGNDITDARLRVEHQLHDDLHVLDHVESVQHGTELALRRHLLAWQQHNVQQPIVSGGVRMFVDRQQLDALYAEQGEAALAPARDIAAAAGVSVEHHTMVGDAAESIVKVARETGCAQVVMGTRGLGSVAGMLLGSVATKVIHLSEVPVLLVK